MALVVDIDELTLRNALTRELDSAKRAYNTAKNPAFKPIHEKDMQTLQKALGSITEAKK